MTDRAVTGEQIFKRVDPFLQADAARAKIAAAARKPRQPPPDWHAKIAKRRGEEILDLFAGGMSFKAIAEKISEQSAWPVNASRLRRAMMSDEASCAAMLAAMRDKAHAMIEHAGDMVAFSAVAGEFDKSGKLALALAEKISPELYGAKRTIELTGSGGGPVRTEVVQSPEDAYKAMIDG